MVFGMVLKRFGVLLGDFFSFWFFVIFFRELSLVLSFQCDELVKVVIEKAEGFFQRLAAIKKMRIAPIVAAIYH